MKVIAVCLGNICRSPLAHGILEHLAKESNLMLHVDSAGTAAYHEGEAPCSGSIEVALKNGIDIRGQRARQITVEDLEVFDLILAMDTSNFNDLRRLARNEKQKNKIKMMLDFSFPGQNRSVPDSYYTGNYEEVFNLLYNSCQVFLKEVTSYNNGEVRWQER
jgi:protein-tyrosine phosphatase